MKTITLWRCVGVSELHDLIENGKVLGKIYEEKCGFRLQTGSWPMCHDVRCSGHLSGIAWLSIYVGN